MTPIFVHLEVNGKYYRKKLVALKKTAACEWRFLCINGETDGRIYSELGWKSEQEAIDAATNSETNPISFYDDVQTIIIKAPPLDIGTARTAGQAFEIYRQQHEPRHSDTGVIRDLNGVEMEWNCFDADDDYFRFMFRVSVRETGDLTLIKYFI